MIGIQGCLCGGARNGTGNAIGLCGSAEGGIGGSTAIHPSNPTQRVSLALALHVHSTLSVNIRDRQGSGGDTGLAFLVEDAEAKAGVGEDAADSTFQGC